MLHNRQSLRVLSNKLLRLTVLIRFLKISGESDSRVYLLSLDQRTGPRYDELCFPYVTVLNLGII